MIAVLSGYTYNDEIFVIVIEPMFIVCHPVGYISVTVRNNINRLVMRQRIR